MRSAPRFGTPRPVGDSLVRGHFSRDGGRGAERAPLEKRFADEARFIRSWFENPLRAGAVSPSGRWLARMMARYVEPRGRGPIIELGPGTGSITEALLARGVDPRRLYLVEFDRNFCAHLRRRFPDVHVVEGDAYASRVLLEERLKEKPAAVVSSLPLLVKPEAQRLRLLSDALSWMRPDGVFIQFTYGPASPIPRDGACETAFRAESSPPVWLNLPPARVWVYRRASETESLASVRPPHPAQELIDRLRSGAEKIHVDLRRELEGAKVRLSQKSRAGQPAAQTRRPAPTAASKRGRDGKPSPRA